MKILTQPPRQDFHVYVARPETIWIEREPSDSLAHIYENGYLPYSGAQYLNDIFYSARSARVMLPQFNLTSENRRIAKKFDGQFKKTRTNAKEFEPDEAFWDLCLTYFRNKHGEQAMPRKRLETILSSSLISSVMIYHNSYKPVAYVLEVEDGLMDHYWYSFYDFTLAKQSLGLWLMLDCVRDAKERGTTHYYLGTVYGEKALYKTNFAPLEWWGGEKWNSDTKLLKELGRTD